MDKSGKSASILGYDRLALSFKAMGGGIWDYDIEADSLYCNDRWYEIMGLSPQHDPIRSAGDLARHIHDDDRASAIMVDYNRVSQLLARDERYQVEFRVIPPAGGVRWVRSVACIIRDGAHHLRAVGCITDITEFRAAGGKPEETVGDASDKGLGVGASNLPPTSVEAIGLSSRERECLRWVSMGKTAWETASILGLSQRTIEFHLKNAIRKLDAANKIHAAALAIRLDLL